jgi:hypothetical protein
MGETEQDAIVGRVVREHVEAQNRLSFLMRDARNRAESLRALDEVLYEESSQKIADRIEKSLSILAAEKFDWSKVTLESLKDLAEGIRKANLDLTRTARERRNLGV